ncbi:flagellar hook-basal body complex protein FliE [Inhella sp.]|uniref:flagellar hook-basal body complex protein FliE n=1 Tax=Inhella sp. TaxID=1921806 RepID=UPI0035AF4D0F
MNPVQLKPFDFASAVARAGMNLPAAQAGKAVGAGNFADAMSQALKAVSQQQLQAQGLQRELQLDNPTVSLEETMVSMQKAQVGFQAVMQVRNRLVSAYSDIMNMQI